VVKCEVADTKDLLDATAKMSEDGTTLQLQVVNIGDRPITTTIRIEGFTVGNPVAQVAELSGRLDAVNSAEKPDAVVPKSSEWKHEIKEGKTTRTFAPYSFTIIRWQKNG
jgi:alpha-L-arabinofuranosidase